ncbi:YggS family pyridoxal phosphate-dependent enzyme [Sulfuriferula thiophila]|uniref:YggS family pyridoxal phosphate-dependent enzyme n=1 Tax=Sulfuriferula thiophila TaxID=1781211 RepID=UPI000F604C26|nr:YggS family pyridoxal phosphate-dependent enzyme [Sulfuriferula thiophila]
MDTVKSTLQAVQARIAAAAELAGRSAQEVALLAVSKSCSAEAVRALANAGQREFGESYVQEAVAKIAALADLPLIWHFIGPIQRNKTSQIAENFDWVHGVDRVIVAQRLSTARGAEQTPLNICLQVNVSGEVSKSGVAPEQLAGLVTELRSLPRLRLRGLMAIPQATEDVVVQRAQFARVRECFEQLNRQGAGLDTLSMGMSGDMEAAVAEGATIVRVGTALFGNRIKG